MASIGDPKFDIKTHEDLRKLIGQPTEAAEKRLKFTSTLTESEIEFIQRAPFAVLATVDVDGFPSVSPKGDAPGFVKVISPGLLLIPDRPGNKLIFGLQNILSMPPVQIIFLIPNTCETLRVSGRASLSKDPALCQQCRAGDQDALLVIRIEVFQCYFHCAKAFARSMLWKPETWPATRFKVDVGQIMAKNGGFEKPSEWADDYQKGYDGRVKVVEDFYKNDVWSVASSKKSAAFLNFGLVRDFVLVVAAVGVTSIVMTIRNAKR